MTSNRSRKGLDNAFATIRTALIEAALQKAGNRGSSMQELVAATGLSRSQVDRALRKLGKQSRVEKNGDRYRIRG